MSKQPKFCKDCAHGHRDRGAKEPSCTKRDVATNYGTGLRVLTLGSELNFNGNCGSYEAKGEAGIAVAVARPWWKVWA